MLIKYSQDNGDTAMRYAAIESIKNLDYPFFVGDLCKAAKNKSVLIVTDTREKNGFVKRIDTKYIVRDFEIIPDKELGDSFVFQFQKKDTEELEIFNLRNVNGIEQNNFKMKYYISSLDFKQGELGFTFR